MEWVVGWGACWLFWALLGRLWRRLYLWWIFRRYTVFAAIVRSSWVYVVADDEFRARVLVDHPLPAGGASSDVSYQYGHFWPNPVCEVQLTHLDQAYVDVLQADANAEVLIVAPEV